MVTEFKKNGAQFKKKKIVMSKARLAGNKEKNGTQRDVHNSLPELGLTYSPAIYFIYIIYKCRRFAHDSNIVLDNF